MTALLVEVSVRILRCYECVSCVRFGSKVRTMTFGCVVMCGGVF